MSMDEHDIRALDREQQAEGEKAAALREPELYYDCGTCGGFHERGDGCEWQEHPTIKPTGENV